MIAADTFVAELGADLTYQLNLMRTLDLARAISRCRISEEEVAHVIRRYDMLRAIEDGGGAADVVEVVLQ